MGKKPTLSGLASVKRAEELKPIRDRARKLWEGNGCLGPAEIGDILISEGFPKVARSTVDGWVFRWNRRAAQAEALKVIKPEAAPIASLQLPVTGPQQTTWEDIVSAAPSIEILAQLVLQGFMTELDRRDGAYCVLQDENITLQDTINSLKKELKEAYRERALIMAEFNEKLAKAKIGTLTLDTVKKRLFKKQ